MPDPPEPPQQFVLTAEQLQQLLAGAAAVAVQNAGPGAGAAAAGQLAPCVLGREKTKRYQIFQDWITQAEAKMQFLGITELQVHLPPHQPPVRGAQWSESKEKAKLLGKDPSDASGSRWILRCPTHILIFI